MRRIIILALTAALLLSGCGSSSESSLESPSGESQLSEQPPGESSAPKEEADDVAYEVTYSSAKTYKNSIGTVWVQSIVEIENTGSADLYLSSGNLDLEDADGKLVASRSMVSCFPEVISHGEKGYYYEETTLDELEDPIDLTILPRPNVAKAKVDKIEYSLSELELTGDDFGLKIKGRVENTSNEPESMAYISAILYDASDVPVGLMFTIITEEIAAGDKIGFEMNGMTLPPDVTVDSVARFDAKAYPMQIQF